MDRQLFTLRTARERFSRLFLGGVLACGALAGNLSHASSQDFQSLASIRMQARDFIAAYPYQSPYPPKFQLGNLDSRLRLKACPQPLTITFARPDRPSANTALLVQCPAATGWKIHYPVRIDLFDDVLVTAKPLVKGQNIDESGTRYQKTNVTRLNHGYFRNISALRDLQARRNLARGTVLSPANMEPRLLVRAGQQVTLIVEMNGLRIKALGRAMRSASMGQPVRVRNSHSQRIVEGIVAGDALVKVGI